MFFSATFIVACVLISQLAAPVFKRCFGTGKDVSALPGLSPLLKILVRGSAAEVKRVISRQGIKASITQLQKLELPRETRRKRNCLFVR